MLTFQNFKNGPALNICMKAGLKIDGLQTWSDFTDSFCMLDAKKDGKLPDVFLKMPGSTGDSAVIQAILHAADYSRYADKMKGSGTWSRLQYVTGEHAEAVAASILRRN
jgi:hypothetical protein